MQEIFLSRASEVFRARSKFSDLHKQFRNLHKRPKHGRARSDATRARSIRRGARESSKRRWARSRRREALFMMQGLRRGFVWGALPHCVPRALNAARRALDAARRRILRSVAYGEGALGFAIAQKSRECLGAKQFFLGMQFFKKLLKKTRPTTAWNFPTIPENVPSVFTGARTQSQKNSASGIFERTATREISARANQSLAAGKREFSAGDEKRA